VKSCDAQHKKLFSLINALHETMKVGKGKAVIRDIVRDLERYIQIHFGAEEALLELPHYPALAEHRWEHENFVARGAKFRKDLDANERGDAVAVLTFPKDWLAKHILQTDKLYSSHLNAKGFC
jgi:hemerythrin